MSDVKPAPDCAMVIFGANGDLTKRLVVPALYNLSKSGELPLHFALIGVDHNDRTPEQWREQLHEFLVKSVSKPGAEAALAQVDEAAWKRLADSMSYVSGDFNDAGTFQKLKAHLAERDEKDKLGGNALFYLATADRFFGPLVDALSQADLLKEDGKGWRRVVIEKPFGHDLASAKALNARVLKDMREEQVFRIDHFLGKETVQNIMALRFANGLFEPIWNRDRIDHVQITVAETVGVERRGNFYESTGALRDMVPNHLFQLLAMTAMEPPASFEAEAVRARKADVFKAIRPLKLQDVVRGQYDVGLAGGQPVPAYRSELNVDPNSSIETYVALKLEIDNWRWAGVPFYLRTGKRLTKRTSEIAIRFREAPFMLFKDTPVDELGANWLIVQIQPDEGIRLRFNAKKPGEELALEGVSMDFKYADWFKQSSAVGYETLLYDVFIGDNTLFQRADQVEAAWAVVEPVLEAWANQRPKDFPNYAAGSAGPDAATNLIARDHRTWRKINRMPGGTLFIDKDADGVARHARDWLVARIAAGSGPFRLALSGGSTPRLLYRLLADVTLPWDRLELYWGDERFVPWDDADSNYRMARDEWLARVEAPASQIHPIPTDTTPEDCAARYEALLRDIADRRGPAFFDVVLLGLGADGHTASLLPNQPVLDERAHWVAPVLKGRDEPRITLTYPALESSRAVAFLVTGSEKRDAVVRTREGDIHLPAARLQPKGETVWFLDDAAAGA